jgi:hypothetical protein
MPTVVVCKACGEVIGEVVDGAGNPTCGNIFCAGSPGHNVPVEVSVPDTANCSSCGQVASYKDGRWLIGDDKLSGRGGYRNTLLEKLPFYSAKGRTYYCGCRGWD